MNEQPIQERYSDLVNRQNDNALQQLVHDLDASYKHIEPPPQLTWNALRVQHMQKAAAKPRGIATLFRTNVGLSLRISVVLFFLLALLVIASTTYAALLPLLTQAFNIEPGTQQLLQNHQYKDLHIPKTLGGFTFTVQKAYADANRVIIGLTMKNPHDQPSDEASFVHMKLVTQQGWVLRPVGGNSTLDKGVEGDVFSFDASSVQGNPSELHVALIADTLNVVRFDHTIPQEISIKGSLVFYFSVPFHRGRILDRSQSETAGGRIITLEKVVVTSSETQAYIQGIDVEREEAFFTATLVVEGHEYNVMIESLGENNTFVLTFPYALMAKHGTWILTIKQDPNTVKFSPTPTIKGGPWVFHFMIP